MSEHAEGLSRRLFLQIVCFSSVVAFGPRLSLKTTPSTEHNLLTTSPTDRIDQLRTSSPEAFSDVIASVNALDVSKDPYQFQQSMHALARLFRESLTVGADPTAATAALDRVRQIVKQQVPWDPVTFQDFADYLGDAASDPSRLKLALSTAKYAVGIVNAPAGAVLQGESLVYEWMSSEGLLSSAPPPADVMQGIGVLAFHKMNELEGKQPLVAEAFTSGALTDVAKVGPHSDAAAIFAALPDSAKAVCTAEGASGDNKTQITAITAALTGQMKELQNTNKELLTILKSQEEEKKKEKEAAIKAAEYARRNQEISSAISIGGFIIEHLFGDPQAAKVVTGIATAIQSMANTINAFTNSQMGVLGLCSNSLNTAVFVASLFNQSPTADELILKGIGELKTQIDEFRRDVDLRLSIIDQKQEAILNGISKMYQDLMAGQKEAIDILNTLQQDLAALSKKVDVIDRQTKLGIFDTNLIKMRSILQDKQDPSFKSDYKSIIAEIAGFGLFSASHVSFVSADYSSGGSVDPTTFSSTVHTVFSAEHLIGLLEPMCRNAGLTSKINQPASFIAWAQTVAAYLEARVSASDFQIKEFEDTIIKLWRKGVDLLNAISFVSAADTLQSTAERYLRQAVPESEWKSSDPSGLHSRNINKIRTHRSFFSRILHLGRDAGPINEPFTLTKFVRDSASDFLASLIPGFAYGHFVKEETPKREVIGPLGNKLIITDIRISGEFYRDLTPIRKDFKIPLEKVTNLRTDPLQKCLETGLLRLVPTVSFDFAGLDMDQTHTDCFQIEVLYGPDKGKKFGKQKTLRRVRALEPDLNGKGYYWIWMPEDPAPGSEAPFTNTSGLLAFCDTLVNFIYTPDKIRTEFYLALSSKLNETLAKTRLSTFYAFGASLRLFATFARMRKLRNNSADNLDTDVRNIDGIFTADEVAGFVAQYLGNTDLPPNTDWPQAIASAISSAIIQSVSQCMSLMNGVAPNEGISIIDETLRTLETYMKMNKIAVS